MGKKFRLTAWILAVSILLNMVPLPASSQENAAAAQSNAEESIQNVQPLADVDDELNNNQTSGTGDGENAGTGDGQNGGTGDGQNGGTGDGENGGTGDGENGGTGDGENGGTGDGQNGGTGDGENGDTGSDPTGGTGEELIVGDDNELIIGDDNNLGDSGSDQSDDVTDEELMIMPLEGESGKWESLDDWKAECSKDKYNENRGLVIDSGWDLICLSNIEDPTLYNNKKLVLTNPNLDTTTCPEGADPQLAFKGLGTADEPFVGIVEYGGANDATITLNRPLFNRLSFRDTTSICKLYLKSSQNKTALLADTVDGCTNGAIQVVLEKPVASEDVSAVLPPVFQTINVQGEQETNIQISVTNQAAVGVTGNGLICNKLDTNAQLTVTGITNYPGCSASGDVGGLVGTMESGSILQVEDSVGSGSTEGGTAEGGASEGGASEGGSTEGGETQSSLAAGSTAIEISSVSGSNAGGLVGTMKDTATVNVNAAVTVSGISGSNGSNAGGLVGTMKGTARVNVNAAVTVSGISGSNAGGLVGKMESGATLNADSGSLILKDTDDTKAVTGSSNAGGCVGFATDIVFSIPTITVDSSATVYGTGSAGVGGLIGAYTYKGTSDVFNSVTGITIPRLTLACAGNGGKSGALFGKLSNDSESTFSISYVTVTDVVFQNGSAGGLIGQYGTTGLNAALEISNATVSTSLTSNAKDYGGLIGVDDCGRSAYIKIYGNTTVTMNSSGTPTDFGGLVSRLQGDTAGHLLNLEGTVTVNVTGNFKSSASTGGLVAYLPNGVIRIGGKVTINGTLAPEEKNRYRSGWVVGDLENALVYVDQSVEGAGLTRPSGYQYNDLGRWGQVLEANDANLPDLLTFEGHKVTVKKVTEETCVTHGNTTYSVSSPLEFATVALRLQLNPVDALVFDGGDISSPVDITIGDNITLSNGLFGLQRDHKESDQFDVTIHGGWNTITLPNTTVYPTDDFPTDNPPTGGSHNRLGLLSNVSALKADGLTVAGRITFDQSSGPIYVGGLAAFAADDVTLTSVTGSVNITGSSTNGDMYIGGLLGIASNTVTVNNSKLQGGTITRTGTITDAKVGGLVASLSGGTLNIDGLTISNAHIEAQSATGTCGGLLSYELLDTTTNIVGVTITGSSVNAGSAGFGGLVYKASGVMTIGRKDDHGTVSPGVSISAGNSFGGKTLDNAPSGLLVCRGDQKDENDKALYLKVLDGAYSVDSGTTVTLSGTYFDELVGITKSAYGNGVVSIATDGDIIDDSGCNTYQQKIINVDGKIWDNPKTRYYYNLDSFDPADGTVNSPKKMVMWSVSQYCANNLKTNFTTDSSFVISGSIPLAGYSYYPVSPRDGVSIDGATITFAYKDLVDKELRTGSDVENKKPSNSDRQHYLMHTGLFTDVTGDLTVNNLTLKGTVGQNGDGSGALISGSISSNKDAGSKTLTINSLTLNNLTIYGGNTSGYAPLLINRIGSYVTMNMDGVSTTGYATRTPAATSLIGNVGDATSGTDIRLTFSNMALDAKMDGVVNPDYYGSQGTIFSHATFLESFAYSDTTTCFGEYNFVMSEGKYTVGKEISNTDSGRNMTNQYKDSDEKWVQYPDEAVTTETEPKHFWEGYLPYVCVSEDEGNKVYELDINQRPKDLIKGCGTYGDPYVIEYASQLAAVAKIIRGESVYDWPVRMNDQVLNGDFGNQNGHGPNPDSGDTNYALSRSDGKWHPQTGDLLDNVDVREYLRNAYYQISDDLNLSSTWGGLGSVEKPFMGVIVGEKTGETCHTITITATQAMQYGGLVKFSQGSVIKDLKIEFSGNATVLDAGAPSSLRDAAFFGGVVGWCHGGDTIIDNVTVTGLNVSNDSTLAAVGGYVGLVGGYDAGTGGGVVFKGTIGDGLSGVTVGKNSISATDGNYFYVNPYVGRVLDGYAVYDGSIASTKTLDNRDKNYKIPTITGSEHLSWDEANKKLTVKDADGLWLLSAIVNSGSTGKARSCSYSLVGQALSGDTLAELNDENGRSKPYLLHTYTDADVQSLLAVGITQPITIELGGKCDMTGYGNGFRGIGSSYSNERLLNVGSLDGQNQKVILNQNRREYTAESAKWVSRGAGLFTQLNLSGRLAVSNLTLCGQTGITYEKDANVKYDSNNYPGAGLLVGLLKSTGKHSVSLDNVSLAKDDNGVAPKVVGTAANAGGLIGYYNADKTSATLTDCDCSNVTVSGGMNAGGLVGYFRASSATVSYGPSTTLTDINVTANKESGLSGSGGLIGKNDQTVLTIGGDNRLTIKGLDVKYGTSANASDNLNSGGLVGLWCAKQNTDAVIQNISLEGDVTIAGGSNVGGLTGALLHDATSWSNGGGIKPTITGVYIAQKENSNVTIIRGRQLGALIGVMKASGATNISDIRVGSSESTVVVANKSEVAGGNNSDAQSIGGLFGIVLVPNNMTMSSVQMTGVKVLVRHSKMRGAGVIFGHIESAGTVRMANVLMDQCEAVIDGDKPIGLIAGLLKNNGVKVYGTDILARDCTLGVALKKENNKYSATTLTNSEGITVPTYDAVGLSNGSYQPYSELATYDRDKLANYIKPSNMGIWFGNANKQVFNLVGVSIVLTERGTASLPVKDVGTNPGTNNYIIRSNYLGVDVVDETKKPVEVHATDKPDTNCGSLQKLEDNKKLTGDGVYFFDEEAKESVANAILADYSGKNWKRMGLNSDVAKDIGTINADTDYFKLTTFAKTKSKAPGTSIIPDFPVLKITAKDAKTINEVVDAYISVLTNTHFIHTSDANGKVQAIANCPYTIEATTYAWNGSAFVQTVGTLKVDVNGNVLQSNGGSYDCDKDQFTLLDVKFADPKSTANPKPTAYHLYIPVAIEKKLEYKFWAAAQVGTSYNAGAYSNLGDVVIGSHHEPVTVMIGFEYPREKAEWQSAVDSGENLLWSLDKVITLTDAKKDDTQTPLPDGTELILVDRGTMADASQKDRAYTATVDVNAWKWAGGKCTLDFTKFTAMDGSGKFQARDFCDALNLTAEQDKNGLFVEATGESPPSLHAQVGNETKYFRLAETGERGQKYSVTVGISAPLSEQYYLTIRTPEVTRDNSPINYFTVWYENPTNTGGMPTELISWANDRYYAKNNNENQIILSNFFKQNFEIQAETPGQDPVEAKTGDDVKSRRNIVATLKTVIEFESGPHARTFEQYLYGRRLYQCFDLSLVEVVNEVQSNKPIVKGAQIAVDYGDGSGRWVEGGTISLTQSQESVRLIGDENGYSVNIDENGTLTMEAKVYLAYDAAGIVEQFPTRPEGTTDGIQIRGSSSLAYSKEALSNSFIRENGQDTAHTYYRKSDSAATMSYSARENEASAPGDSVSQLGINGLEDNFPIQSLGVYNVERVENASSAKYLECTVSLYCKDNVTNQYTMPVTGSIGSYLKDLKLGLDITDAGGNIAHTDMTAPSEEGSVTFALPQPFDPGSFIEIPVEMNVLTGEAFEAEGYRYANYQVRLTARLLDEDRNPIGNSEASDYIVYTNAKILRELIFQQTSG